MYWEGLRREITENALGENCTVMRRFTGEVYRGEMYCTEKVYREEMYSTEKVYRGEMYCT